MSVVCQSNQSLDKTFDVLYDKAVQTWRSPITASQLIWNKLKIGLMVNRTGMKAEHLAEVSD